MGRFKSTRLKELLSYDVARPGFLSGMFPARLMQEVARFDSLILWKRVAGPSDQEIPEPQRGLDENFDAANNAVTAIKKKLDEYLIHIQAVVLRDNRINYSHAKYRYELEVPAELTVGDKKPRDFELTSARKGYERF